MPNMIADNYGNRVDGDDFEIIPQDLDMLSDSDLAAILKSDWWEVHSYWDGDVDVSLCALTPELIANGAMFDTEPVRGKPFVANKIAMSLKRWSLEDGFYHA